MTNVLEKIINSKKTSVEKYKNSLPLNVLKKRISKYENYINFKNKLNTNEISSTRTAQARHIWPNQVKSLEITSITENQ